MGVKTDESSHGEGWESLVLLKKMVISKLQLLIAGYFDILKV